MSVRLRLAFTALLVLTAACFAHQPAAAQESGSVLSLFEDQAGKCLWQKLELDSGKKKKLAAFERSCLGASAVVNRAQTYAVAWFREGLITGPAFGGTDFEDYPKSTIPQKSSAGINPALWAVDLVSGAASSLRLPANGQLEDLRIDDQKQVWAFTTEDPTEQWQQPDWDRLAATKKFKFKQENYDFPSSSGEGVPAVVTALRWSEKSKSWEIKERKGTHTGWDYALGIGALEQFRTCCGQLDERGLDTWQEIGPEIGPEIGKDQKDLQSLAAKLKTFDPGKKPGTGQWRYIAPAHYNSAFKAAVWAVSGEFLANTGLFLFFKDGDVLIPEKRDFGASDLPEITFDSRFMLVTISGLRSSPRLYDLDSAKLRISSDSAFGVGFWKQLVPSAEKR